MSCLESARTIYIRCIYGIFGNDITKYTVIYGVYIRFWPTLFMPQYTRGFTQNHNDTHMYTHTRYRHTQHNTRHRHAQHKITHTHTHDTRMYAHATQTHTQKITHTKHTLCLSSVTPQKQLMSNKAHKHRHTNYGHMGTFT